MNGELNDVNTDITNGVQPMKSSFLDRLGINTGALSGLKGTDLNQWTGKAREYARSNPARTLGTLSALVIGAGLLTRGRR